MGNSTFSPWVSLGRTSCPLMGNAGRALFQRRGFYSTFTMAVSVYCWNCGVVDRICVLE